MADIAIPLPGSLIVADRVRGPLFATFLWHSSHAHTVTLWFANDQCWHLSRDLLVDGIDLAAGDDGEVLVQRMDHDVHLSRRSPHGKITVAFPHSVLSEAVRATEALVPLGSEQINWDAEARFLDGAR